ncbi:MAG: hypothetical protein H0T42_25850 [Deltaproteobacteria bacterium]|nr:hypothetical protein [Deltaproteobacteria bacterium]
MFADHLAASAKATENSRSALIGTIDVETGTEQVLGLSVLRTLAVSERSIFIHGDDGSLNRYDARLEAERLAASGTFAMDTSHGRVVLASTDLLVVHEPDKAQRRRAIELDEAPRAVRLSPRGDRVAVLLPGAIFEWQVDGLSPPRRWARSGNADGQGIAYVGETLYAWDDSGGGLVSLESELPISRWSYRGTTLRFAPFSEGIVLATVEGRLAYVGPLGVVEIPHRRLELKTIAVDPDGRNLVIGALSGELMTIDLRPVRPRLVAVPETATLRGLTANSLLLGDATRDASGSTSPTRLALLDLTSGKRSELGSIGFSPYVYVTDTMIVAGGGVPPKSFTLHVWDHGGRERVRTPYASHIQVGDGLHAEASVIYGTPDGDLVEQPLDPFGPARRVRTADGRNVTRIHMTSQGVAVATVDFDRKPMRTTIGWIDRGDRKVAPFELDGFAFPCGVGPDGAMWIVKDVERVIRVAPDGAQAEVPLPQSISSMVVRGSRIWAVGTSSLYALAPDGAVVRTVTLPTAMRRGNLRDGLISLSDDGLWVTMPDANVSRLLPLPGGAEQQTATRDGRSVAAMTRTSPRYVAVWKDPVPVDPAAVPAYLEQLTNARLDLASSAVTWDSPRP